MGKVALITGGRSGIGLACAHKLSQKGYEVVTAQRSPAVDFYSIEADFSESITPQKVIQQVIDRHGRLDVLINNACQTIRRPAAYYHPLLKHEANTIDAIEDDKPTGTWSVTYDSSNTTACVKSFYWPGYFFFQTVGAAEYGGVYFGNGMPNKELAFGL